MTKRRQIQLDIKGSPETVSIFLPLLDKGFSVCVEVGSNVQDFLCKQIGLSPDYLEDRIQTLFVDGKAVDDFADTIINNGTVLALSGAMPGLAGATLRRGGFYGKMRGEISHSEDTAPDACGEGHVTVKLFNLILKETGPLFLSKGVVIQGEDLKHRLNMVPGRLDECESITLDGQQVDPAAVKEKDWNDSDVFLQVS